MKRIAIFLTVVLTVTKLFGEIRVDRLYYEIIGDNEVRFIRFDDDMMNSKNLVGRLEIPPYIEYEGQQYTVTEMGDRCLWKDNLQGIYDLYIPHTIKRIGNEIFGSITIHSLWFSADYPFPATTEQFSKRGSDGLHWDNTPCKLGWVYVPEGTLHRYLSAPGFRSLANANFFNLNYDEYPGLEAKKGPFQFYEADDWVIMPVDTSGTAGVNDAVLCYHIDKWRMPDELSGYEWYGFSHLTIPSTLTVDDGTEYVIREIADEAFYLTADELSVDVPATVTKVGVGAFADSNIESVKGMASVREMGNACFANSSMVRLKFPEKVNTVPDRCFACFGSSVTGQHIEWLEFHKNVRSYGKEIFYCSSVDTMICYNPKPVPIDLGDSGNESGSSFGILYVPAESVDLYKNSDGWNRFAEILPIGSTAIDEIATDNASETPEYYNLQGVKISNPTPGTFCIERRGTQARKLQF